MFQFCTAPDPVLIALDASALQQAVDPFEPLDDRARDAAWLTSFPAASQQFAAEEGVGTLVALESRLTMPAIFDLAAAEWVLVLEAVAGFSTRHNATSASQQTALPADFPGGITRIDRLDLATLVALFFPAHPTIDAACARWGVPPPGTRRDLPARRRVVPTPGWTPPPFAAHWMAQAVVPVYPPSATSLVPPHQKDGPPAIAPAWVSRRDQELLCYWYGATRTMGALAYLPTLYALLQECVEMLPGDMFRRWIRTAPTLETEPPKSAGGAPSNPNGRHRPHLVIRLPRTVTSADDLADHLSDSLAQALSQDKRGSARNKAVYQQVLHCLQTGWRGRQEAERCGKPARPSAVSQAGSVEAIHG